MLLWWKVISEQTCSDRIPAGKSLRTAQLTCKFRTAFRQEKLLKIISVVKKNLFWIIIYHMMQIVKNVSWGALQRWMPLNIKLKPATFFSTLKNISQHSTSATLKSYPQHNILQHIPTRNSHYIGTLSRSNFKLNHLFP